MQDPTRRNLSRRDFIASLLATGFALAVHPISAATLVTTDSKGIVADLVRIPAAGALLPAYLAHPDHGERWPLVLVVHEIFGVHEHIRDICRRLAKLGYLAIAPELFFRQGDVSGMQEIGDIIAKVVSQVPDAQVLSDLDATSAWAQRSGMVDGGRTGITGFCWGGRIAWLYAAHNPDIKAGVAWYGRLEGERNERQPTYPVDQAAPLKVPVLGLYGGADRNITQDAVARMRGLLNQGESGSQIIVYPDAPHAFFADYRPSYRQQAAADGWKRLQAWFNDHGLAP